MKIQEANQKDRTVTALSLVMLLGLLLPITKVNAQPYKLAWSNTKGGGGTHSNGRYTLSGTIGQPEAGTLTNGRYALNLGFQRIIAVLQTPGAPLLTITRSGANVIVSWPSPSTGFALQQNSDLAPTAWSFFSGTVNSNATTLSITVPASPGNKFYRLKK